MSDIEQFRAETRAWLEDNCPASMRTPSVAEEMVWGGRRATFTNPDSKVWLERMGAKGWTAPMWPAQYGGGGLSMAENAVLESELRRIKARPALASFGLWMLGPVLGGFLAERGGVALPFVLVGGAVLSMAPAVHLLLPETLPPKEGVTIRSLRIRPVLKETSSRARS